MSLPDGEKNFEDVFIRFGATHECDSQTDGQTDRHRMPAIAALMHSIARQKYCGVKAFTASFGVNSGKMYDVGFCAGGQPQISVIAVIVALKNLGIF